MDRVFLRILAAKSTINVTPDQLLLFEDICRQLSTVSYHPGVQSVQGCSTAVTSRPSTSISYCKNNTLSVSDKEVRKLIPTSQSVAN